MENKPETSGVTTRSKAVHALVAGEKPEENAACASPKETHANDVASVSNRSGREAARLRAEYEAEKQMAKVKESLIKKKLALEIAEIDDEFPEDKAGSIMSEHRVTHWLPERRHVAEYPPAGEAACHDDPWKFPSREPLPRPAYESARVPPPNVGADSPLPPLHLI